MEHDPSHASPDEPDTGLGHTRSGIHKRARWFLLVLLALPVVVVAAFMGARATDRLDSEVTAFRFENNVATVEIATTNTGSGTATVLSLGVNAGSSAIGAVRGEGINNADDIGPGETVVYTIHATILCEAGDRFEVEPVVRIQDRQKGRWIVFHEPGDWKSETVTCT